MKKLTYILILFTSFHAVAQNFADSEYYLVDSLEIDKVSASDKLLIDSCLAYFHQAEQDTDKLHGITKIVEESWDNKVWPKYNLWLYHFTQQKLKENPPPKITRKLSIGLASALNNIGYHNSTKGNSSEALKFYHRSLNLQEKLRDKEGIATSLNNIGSIHKKQGDIPNALEYFHKSLQIYTEIDNTTGLGQALNNIGSIYQEQGDPNLALEYFHRGHNLYKKIGDERSMATILNNIGFAYFKKENNSKALDYYNQSITIRQKLGDKNGIAICYNNIASVYENQLEMEKAMEFYLKSNQIYKDLGYKLGLSTSSVNIGRILYGQGKLLQSKKYVLSGLELAKKSGSPRNIQGSAKLLSQIYEQEGKGMEALKMHKLFILMRDSVDNETNQKAIIQQHAKYEYQKKKAIDDAEHDKLMAMEQTEKEKQVIISYGTAFGLVLVIIFSFFAVSRLKIAKRQKTVIEIQNKEIVDSITYAKRIQEAILPDSEYFKSLFPKSFIYYKPKDIVAGDFYWLEKQDEKIFFAVADCTGHGVPGAMVSVVCHNAMNSVVKQYNISNPGEVLDKTREIVVNQFNKVNTFEGGALDNIRDGMDIALCVLNTKTNELQYSGAYNPLWIIRGNKNEIEEIKANRQSIGKMDYPLPFDTHKVILDKGDNIYLFSDGFSDQFGGVKGKKMMSKQFKKLIVSMQNEPMENQLKIIHSHFEIWKGDLEQLDDVCVMGIRI